MNLTNAIEPVTVLKTRSAELIRRARETGQPVVITQNGKPTAVLQDVETYQRQRDALLMLKLLSQGEEDFRQGRWMTHEDANKHFEAKLRELKNRG